MERDGSGVSALVGLDGFVVTAQLFDDDSGEWWLAVETTEDRAWCETCGCGRSAMAAAGSWCGICRWRAVEHHTVIHISVVTTRLRLGDQQHCSGRLTSNSGLQLRPRAGRPVSPPDKDQHRVRGADRRAPRSPEYAAVGAMPCCLPLGYWRPHPRRAVPEPFGRSPGDSPP